MTPTLSRQDQLGELAVAVLRQQFDALRSHEAGTRAGTDAEELHDMRVATRRLRAALRCFEDVLPTDAPALRRELGWLGKGLAAVRDLDVQLLRVAELRSALPESDHAAVAAFGQALEQERLQARTTLLEVLDSERYRLLLAWGEPLLVAPPEARQSVTIELGAPPLVEWAFRRLRRLGDALDRDSPGSDLHALRIRAKRVRYAVEFVSDVYGQPARRFVRRIVELQDLLGQHQDAEVAVARLRGLAGERSDLPPAAVFVMGEFAQRYLDDAARLRASFPRVYRRATGKRWRRLKRSLRKKTLAVPTAPPQPAA